jgi:myo-inositol 2-dehydrogenase/D-chiro-inositol 1-dehydrogenase
VSAPLRVGLIGCGRAAERLWIPAFRAVPEARLTAVVDPRAERRALISRAGSAERALERADALFARREVDAAIIATPPETHGAIARLGLEAGVPLLVEKPLATTIADAAAIAALAQATGTPVMVGFNRRWWPPAERLRELLGERRSTPALAELAFVGVAERWVAIDGLTDLLDDLGSHQFDLLRFLFGAEIETVSATRVAPHEIRMVAQLADGTAARCRLAHAGISEESVRVTTTGGRYRIHATSGRVTPADGPARVGLDLSARIWRRATGARNPLLCSFERELRAFVAAVREGIEPRPGAADGVVAARAVTAARESLAHGGSPAAVAARG